jgi:multidrug efflux pump subunit AcrB
MFVPMAITILLGLLIATRITLLLVPVFYGLFSKVDFAEGS